MRARLLAAASTLTLAAAGSTWFLLQPNDTTGRLTAPADPVAAEEAYLAILSCFEEDGGSAQPTACKDRVARLETSRASLRTLEAALERGLEAHPDLFGPACHSFTHLAGQHAARNLKDIEALSSAASQSAAICQHGLYHGLVEGYAGNLKFDRLREELPLLCAALKEAGTFELPDMQHAEGECNHVLGHVAARTLSDDVPAGLALCDTLPHDGARIACGTGVIMNWTDGMHRWATGGEPASAPLHLGVDPARRWEICLKVPDFYRAPCALWMGSSTIVSTEADHIRDMLSWYPAWCAESFEDRSVVAACWASVGMMGGDIATMRLLGGWEGSLALCRGDAEADHLDLCVSQMLSIAASFLPDADMLEACDFEHAVPGVCARAESMVLSRATGSTGGP